MLVLERGTNQRITIGPDITITIVRVEGRRVRVGIDCPKGVAVHRDDAWSRAPRPDPGADRPGR
jgi:carbon storage regulator